VGPTSKYLKKIAQELAMHTEETVNEKKTKIHIQARMISNLNWYIVHNLVPWITPGLLNPYNHLVSLLQIFTFQVWKSRYSLTLISCNPFFYYLVKITEWITLQRKVLVKNEKNSLSLSDMVPRSHHSYYALNYIALLSMSHVKSERWNGSVE